MSVGCIVMGWVGSECWVYCDGLGGGECWVYCDGLGWEAVVVTIKAKDEVSMETCVC